MNLLSLLHLALKSDEVIDLLELHEIKVNYDFDRTHEGIPDIYWASCQEVGFELRFNENQVLVTIFMYILPRDGFTPIETSITGVPIYRNFAEVKAAFQCNAVAFSKAKVGEGWIKGDFGEHAVHYEFNQAGALSLVTVMAVDA